MSTTNTDRARAALLAIELLASAPVFGVQVERTSLLGYRVGTEVLEVEDAAARLAQLVWRVRGALATYDWKLRDKYGPYFSISWLNKTEWKRREGLYDAADKAGTAIFAYIQAVSPRDWSYGVPSYWVRETLTWEDATRPVDEPLGATPPLSYGSTRPRT